MSHLPEFPGRQRLKRAAFRSANDAYQGAFEAVGAVLVGCGIGYWIDAEWETGPIGLLVGTVIGFGAMVLRLVRLGKALHPEVEAEVHETDGADGEDEAMGERPGLSSALRPDEAPDDEAVARGGKTESQADG